MIQLISITQEMTVCCLFDGYVYGKHALTGTPRVVVGVTMAIDHKIDDRQLKK
jgi:hypothetical protein